MSTQDWTGIRTHIDAEWDTTIVPTLSEYIRVPNQSPDFDPEWATNGLLRKAMDVLVQWVHVQKIAGMKYEVMNETGRTPFLVIEVDAFHGCPVDDKPGGQVMPTGGEAKHSDKHHTEKHHTEKHHTEKHEKHHVLKEQHAAKAEGHHEQAKAAGAAEAHHHDQAKKHETKEEKHLREEQEKREKEDRQQKEKAEKEARKELEKREAAMEQQAKEEKKEHERQRHEMEKRAKEAERAQEKTEKKYEQREKKGDVVYGTDVPVETSEQAHHEYHDKHTTNIHKKGVLMYGHMDKQPPMTGWDKGLEPYLPVYRDGRLYGRGGADDGYAVCAALTAIAALQRHGIPHSRIVIVIEGAEESDSTDLAHYIEKIRTRIGDIDLVVCLDSGAMNYDQMWVTSSLRGVIGGTLKVEVLNEGVHSGAAGGVAPDSMRIIRQLLDRIEDRNTGDVHLPGLSEPIPDHVRTSLESMRVIDLHSMVPLRPGVQTEGVNRDSVELAERNYWRPCMTVTGQDGLPSVATGGNVIRKGTSVKLSLRLPPHVDATKATKALKDALTSDPPNDAKVQFIPEEPASGWTAPMLHQWLVVALDFASKEYFGKTNGTVGLGGAIPFMSMLGGMFPKAQFVVTGVLGPKSNAHGPNEFLHVPFAKGITYCVARIIGAHAVQKN